EGGLLAHPGAAPLRPGERVEVEFLGRPEQPRLSFATMVMASNDVFLAPEGAGIALFDADGRAFAARDVTSLVHLWNAGTEVDQAPGLGPLQPAQQTAPNTGPREGTIRRYTE